MKRIVCMLASVVFLCTASFVHAQNVSVDNVGIIQDTIWFSQKDFIEGDKITIYTFVFNGAEQTLSGVVDFFDKQVLIASKSFSLNPKTGGTMSVPFTAILGEHVITAKIRDTKLGTKTQTPVTIDNIRTKEKSFTVLKKQDPNAPEEEQVTTETSIPGVDAETVNAIESKIVQYTPAPVQHAVKAIDTFRANKNTDFITEKNTAKAELEKIKSTPAKTQQEMSQSGIKTPMLYARMFFAAIASFVFGHKILFYGLGIFFIVVVLKGIFQRIFN